MKEIPPTARRKRSFPIPINVNARSRGDHEQDQNEKRALQSAEYKSERARRKICERRGGQSLSRDGFDFEGMILLESARAEPPQTSLKRFKQIDKDQSLPFPFHHEDLPT